MKKEQIKKVIEKLESLDAEARTDFDLYDFMGVKDESKYHLGRAEGFEEAIRLLNDLITFSYK